MNKKYIPEILLNATQVTTQNIAKIYEFILDVNLNVIECVRVESLVEGIVTPVDNYLQTLTGTLFELNHVRVNPKLDNTVIIESLTKAFEKIGVGVNHPPSQNSMALCIKPLGEITQNVRFYFDKGGACVFLCPQAKLRVLPGSLPNNLPTRRPKHRR